MIVCPNCNHSNPDGAQACEACYTALPTSTSCPNCGSPVQTDASFCGQCGSNLDTSTVTVAEPIAATNISSTTPVPSPIAQPLPVSSPTPVPATNEVASPINPSSSTPVPATNEVASTPEPQQSSSAPASTQTQLQQQTTQLLHVQTNTVIELPQNLSVIHIGKQNDRIPPDVDVSGFPNSEVVSRIHADIRVEGDAYYLEDVGSSNGTYINNLPLPPGNRHRLRAGDRIALGKGDLMTFLFQVS